MQHKIRPGYGYGYRYTKIPADIRRKYPDTDIKKNIRIRI